MSKQDYRNQLKIILKGYKRITPKIKHDLHCLGISIERSRNHVLLSVPHGDGYRLVPIPCTGSDKRNGLNIITKIIKSYGGKL